MISFAKKHIFLTTILTFLICFFIFGIFSVISSRHFHYHIHHTSGSTISNISVDISDDSLLELKTITSNKKETLIHLSSLNSGKGVLNISYNLNVGDKIAHRTEVTNFLVSKTGMIFIGDKLFDYTGFSIMYYSYMLHSGLMAFYFFWLRRELQKESYYSFRSINYCSAGIFFSVICIIYFIAILASIIFDYNTSSKMLILITQNFFMAYSIITIPFMTIFYISLAISNIALIKHEGKRLVNMLGIFVAFVMAIGTAINAYLFSQNIKYGLTIPTLSVSYTIYSSGFSIFQVMLLASMISCLEAAVRKIKYNKDFIIILGCKIRKDGTLYPLLQGRVDRAIKFWHDQYQATGIKAVFVPSGGQGDDEIMSEAAAMENYLLEKGFTKDLIMTECKSTSTLENMAFSKNLIYEMNKNANIAFSTTNYHVFRSGILAEKANLKADGIGSHTKWYFWPNAMLREVVGMFVTQTKFQWIMTALLILLAGLFEYLVLLT